MNNPNSLVKCGLQGSSCNEVGLGQSCCEKFSSIVIQVIWQAKLELSHLIKLIEIIVH